MGTVEVALASEDQLGEAPFWDERSGELLRVDISRGCVHGWNPSSGAVWVREYEGEVSAVVPRSGSDGWVLAAGHRILLDDGERLDVVASVEEHLPHNRFNDCKCDSKGRLWAGSMSKQRSPGDACLYRLGPSGDLQVVLAGTTLSNGLGWSPQGEWMYFIDSTTQRIDVMDFQEESGEVENRRPFAKIDEADGLPDGMAVDAEGGVWVCLFGGGALRRYGPEGTLEAIVSLPVTNPTSPVFGGPRFQTLYVTSARHRLPKRQLAAEPLAGALLAVDPEVPGQPGNRFRG